MTGHQSLTALRMKGYTPPDVVVYDCTVEPIFFPATHPEMLLASGFRPEIDVMPTDNPATLDFRCLRGVIVHVIGDNHRRVRALFNRIQQFEPAQVIAVPGEFLHWKAE